MSVLKALAFPETIETNSGTKKATHEAYCYTVTPFTNPPVTVVIFKGRIDAHGQFQAIAHSQKTMAITPEEYKELISPNPQGKRAGDFRLSDILNLILKRQAGPTGSKI